MSAAKRKFTGERLEPVQPEVSRLVDYTTWRAGRITPKGKRIVRCAKCGENGEYSAVRTPNLTDFQAASAGTPFQIQVTIVHRGKMESGAGLDWIHVTERCCYTEENQ